MADEEDTGTLFGRAARRLTREHQMGEFLYGALLSGSVLAISSASAKDSTPVLFATGVVTVTFWLAHVYVDAVGGRFHDQEHSTGQRLVHALRNNTAVLLGSLPTLAVFAVARLFGLDVGGAAWAALWFTVALLGAAGAFAAYRAGVRGWRLIGESAIAVGFGMVVILLKIGLH